MSSYTSVMQADILQEASKGDFTDLLVKLVSPNIQISKPVFFSNSASPQSVLTDTIAAVQFSYTGVGVAPCAVPITPLGVGIFPQGVNIQPEGVNVNPEGQHHTPRACAVIENSQKCRMYHWYCCSNCVARPKL